MPTRIRLLASLARLVLLIAFSLAAAWQLAPVRASAAPAIAQLPGIAPAPPPAASLTPAQAKQILDVLQDDAKRAQFIAVLDNMAKALPPPEDTPLRPDSVGAQLIDSISTYLTDASSRLITTAQAVTDFPLLVHWLGTMADDPDAKAQLLDVAWKLAVVCAAAGVAEALCYRLLRGLRRAIDRRTDGNVKSGEGRRRDHDSSDEPIGSLTAEGAGGPGSAALDAEKPRDAVKVRAGEAPGPLTLLRRIPFVLARLLIDLAPIGMFALVAFGLLATPIGKSATARLVILALINAYLLYRLVSCAARLLVSPDSAGLRLVKISDQGAAYIMVWVGRLTAVAAFGYSLNAFAIVFGLYPSARDALLKLVALVGHIFVVVVILQCRKTIAEHIAPPEGKRGFVSVIRRRLAKIWHYPAIFYVVALWLVWALEVRDGFSRLLRFFVVTVAVVIVTRLLTTLVLRILDRAFAIPETATAHTPSLLSRAGRYHPLLRGALTSLIGLLMIFALFEVWGLNPISWFTAGALGGQLVSALMAIGFTLLLALVVWEFANVAIERRLDKLSREMQAARSARLRTLLPMLRATLFFTISTVTGLMVLSQIGVNTAPLLAGAGVVGVAIGFGSQKLVQDVITGLFLLLENAMQVGDTVNVAGLTGVVEYLSIRTIRLRALDGSVHIIPFSAVTSVTNMTRDYAYAMVDVEVGFNEEPDAIAQILRGIAAEMREEPAWKLALIADIEVMGVEKFTETALVMRIRIRTQPTRRWAVQREFNRRIKYRFDEKAIESPFTSTRILSTVPAPPVVPVAQPEMEARPS